MSNLVANELFEENGAHEYAVESILKGVEKLRQQSLKVFVVTNEICSDGIIYDSMTKKYQKTVSMSTSY
jgi:adenosylcobinamide kinase/adenosylcobinamide-phosphate guanylyltransferase